VGSVKLEPNCIRNDEDTSMTLCGRSSKSVGSISIEHYDENPVGHVDGLLLCPECEIIAIGDHP